MHQTLYHPAHGALFVRHFGQLSGAESQFAVVRAFEMMSIEHRRGCSRVLLDVREVTHATVEETDRAMSSRTERALATLIGAGEKDLRRVLQKLIFTCVMDPDNPCTAILLERIKRGSASIWGGLTVVSNLAEGLACLGLPTDLPVEYPQAPQVHGIATP